MNADPCGSGSTALLQTDKIAFTWPFNAKNSSFLIHTCHEVLIIFSRITVYKFVISLSLSIPKIKTPQREVFCRVIVSKPENCFCCCCCWSLQRLAPNFRGLSERLKSASKIQISLLHAPQGLLHERFCTPLTATLILSYYSTVLCTVITTFNNRGVKQPKRRLHAAPQCNTSDVKTQRQ